MVKKVLTEQEVFEQTPTERKRRVNVAVRMGSKVSRAWISCLS